MITTKQQQMVFTVYWRRRSTTSETFKRFIAMVKVVYPHADSTDVSLNIRGPQDTFTVNMNAGASDTMQFCKTGNHRYTAEVMRALIIMVELNMAYNVDADDNELWLEQLDHIASFVPITTYSKQREHFAELLFADIERRN